MSAEDINYLAPELRKKFENFYNEPSDSEKERVELIYQRLIKEGNPITSSEPKKQYQEVDPSTYDRYINHDGRINFVEIYSQFGPHVGGIVDIAQNVYTGISQLEEAIKNYPVQNNQPDVRLGLVNAQRNYYSDLSHIISPYIDITGLLTRKEQIDLELQTIT